MFFTKWEKILHFLQSLLDLLDRSYVDRKVVALNVGKYKRELFNIKEQLKRTAANKLNPKQ